MDLEVARADRRLDSVSVAARVREGLRDRGLAGAEEAEEPDVRLLRPCQHAAHGLRLDRLVPQPLQLARRAGQHDDDARSRLEHETGRRPRKPE